jgi:hypothetical protein
MRPSVPPPASFAAAVLGASLVASLAAACGGDRRPAPARRVGVDSALARDLTLATGASRRTPSDAVPLDDSLPLGGDTAATRQPDAPPERSAAQAVADPASPREARVPARTATASGAPRTPATVRRAPPPVAVAADATPVPPPPTSVSTPAPTATPAPSPGSGRFLAAGTILAGTLGQRVCSETNRPGDRLVATLGGEVAGPGGVVLPAGTPLVLELARLAGNPPTAEFVVRGVSIAGDFVPIVADASPVTGDVERHQVVDKASDKGKAVQGAVAGAILGQVLGRDTRSTVIGAAGGAAAGAALGRGRSHDETCLAGGAAVRVRLTERFSAK